MDAPQEGKIDVDLCLECDCQTKPSYMNSLIRQQFLQQKIKSMPAAVQNRIVALKNLQLDQLHLEAEFLEKVYKLEKKYQVKYQEICEKRRDILDGTVDPAEQSPNYPSPAIDQDVGDRKRVSFQIGHRMPEDAKGIPGFWLTVFRNTPMLSELIQKHDEPVMRKLTDIVLKYDAGHSYFLEFHFDKNEYFSNTVLTKQYFLKSAVDKNEPFAFKGFQIYKCKGCIINWEKKMNLTVAIIQKKQKHRIRGAIRTVFRQVPTESFFHFFNPPEVPINRAKMDEESQQILDDDFEVAQYLRTRIIPKAVLYFTGDVVDSEDEEEEDESESDESEDDENGAGGNKESPNDCPTQ
ncbi:hypothetical protein ACLKA7_005765 [Drosophila subpalustris]